LLVELLVRQLPGLPDPFLRPSYVLNVGCKVCHWPRCECRSSIAGWVSVVYNGDENEVVSGVKLELMIHLLSVLPI